MYRLIRSYHHTYTRHITIHATCVLTDAFLSHTSLSTKTALEVKPLRFTYSRLNSLLRTLEVTHLDEYNPLQVHVLRWYYRLPLLPLQTPQHTNKPTFSKSRLSRHTHKPMIRLLDGLH